jgi:hypothetical protein
MDLLWNVREEVTTFAGMSAIRISSSRCRPQCIPLTT